MSKDIKEKYEKACAIKDKALCLVESQLNGDINSVDSKELGEVVDIAKDMAELMKYCEEANYYHKVTEAMDDGSDEDKRYYLNKYIPEYEGKFYTPMYSRQLMTGGKYMYTEPSMPIERMYTDNNTTSGNYRNRMYFEEPYHNMHDGKAYMTRRSYMESNDKSEKSQELDKYMHDLADDLTEMLNSADPNDKAKVKQNLINLTSKIA